MDEKHAFLDQKFSDKAGSQDERLDEVSADLQTTQATAYAAIDRIDGQVAADAQELRQQLQSEHEQFDKLCRELHEVLSGEDRKMSERIDSQRAFFEDGPGPPGAVKRSWRFPP